MVEKRKKVLYLTLLFLMIAVLTGWIAWGNKALVVSNYRVSNPELPATFSGFRIAQISDLHNDEFGKNNEKLIELLKNTKPDIITITGDLIDYYDTHEDISLSFIEKIVHIAPCYYVPGNHEARINSYMQFKGELEKLGVHVLENEIIPLERNGETVTLLGVKDPAFLTKIFFPDKTNKSSREDDIIMDLFLRELCTEDPGYRILLSHRPDQIEIYAKYDLDLVLSGHKHGSQFRLPFIGGLFTPSDGFFPKYDAGCYEQNNTTMIVSRGLGNSIFPFRINNRPEIVVVQLESE